jgi:hypothetical protein
MTRVTVKNSVLVGGSGVVAAAAVAAFGLMVGTFAVAPLAGAASKPKVTRSAHTPRKTAKAATATVKAHLLALTDLPAGWSVNNTSSKGSGLATSRCLASLKKHKGQKTVQATASYEQNSNLPVLEELLAAGPGVNATYTKVAKALAKCKAVTLKANGKTLHGTIGQMSFPKVGERSSAYSLGLTLTKVHIGFDLVLFRAAKYIGLVGYADIGMPAITTAAAFVKEAVAKAEGQSVSPPAAPGTAPTG